VKKRAPIDQQKWWKQIRDHQYSRVIMYMVLAIILYFLMLGNVLPDRLDIQLSSIAEQDIRSPITIENREATEERQKEVLDSVSPVYSLDRDLTQRQVGLVDDLFQVVYEVKRDLEEHEEEEEEVTSEEKVEMVQERLSDETGRDLSETTIQTLLETSEAQLNLARNTTVSAVHEIMSESISVSGLSEAKESVPELMTISTVSSQLLDAMIEVAQFAIVPNYTYDEEATERLRQEALDSVEPVIIREGQLLVKEGESINYDTYEQLRLVGLLDDTFNPFPYIGLAILVILIVMMVAYYLKETKSSVQTNNSHLLMYILIFIVTVSVMKIVSFVEAFDIQASGYVVPAALGAMLLTMLVHHRIALFSSIMFAIIGSILFNQGVAGSYNFSFALYILFSSFAAVYFLSRSQNVTTLILRAGLFVSFMNMLILLSILFLKSVQTNWMEVGLHMGFAFASGFLAAVLTLGLMPFFEAGFGILSTSKLIELSNPNHPLLRKILTEAPGTYHHSVVVGNLSEAACESIGENGLLARVGSYYHDLGKTRRPHFFIENQMKMENPHDRISPQLSATIIISHPYDGAKMLKEYKMPKEIIDIAEQHHGTSLLKYFYHKAQQESDQEVEETSFRYPGPKAQSKVAAIVGIADSVEAAVRSMSRPNPNKIEALVRKIITDRLEDGQFDECELTLKDLDQVAKSICETLKGTFHERIEYPEDEKKKESGHEHSN
jgi:putative nucleotidyltransferase with HDIG domain